MVPVLGKRGSQEFLAAVLGNTRGAVKKELASDPVWREVIGEANTAELRPFSVWVSAGQRYPTPTWIDAATPEQAIAGLASVGVRVAQVMRGHSENSKNSHRGGSPIDNTTWEILPYEQNRCRFDFSFGQPFGQPVNVTVQTPPNDQQQPSRGGKRLGAGRPRKVSITALAEVS